MSTGTPPHTLLHHPDLAALQAPLLRFARSRLRNLELAEDAVSAKLLAALEKPQAFATAAQAVAWTYGVLRHKLVDQMRQQTREAPAGDRLPDADTRSGDWTGAGAWHGSPCPLQEPEVACSQFEFLAMLQRCCDLLPALQRQAFLLRELHGLEPEHICQELGVTAGHLWVLVHRARQRLRTLIQAQWPMLDGAD